MKKAKTFTLASILAVGVAFVVVEILHILSIHFPSIVGWGVLMLIANAIIIAPIKMRKTMNNEEREIYIKKLTLTAVGLYVLSTILLYFPERNQFGLLDFFMTLGITFLTLFLLKVSTAWIDRKKQEKGKLPIFKNYLLPSYALSMIIFSFFFVMLNFQNISEPLAEARRAERRMNELEATTSNCNIIARGEVGNGGAPWLLCENGVVKVGGGTIWHNGNLAFSFTSAWHEPNCNPFDDRENRCFAHDIPIREIIFTEPVTARNQLVGLFAWLPYLETIENIHYIDTSNVTRMTSMFERTGLTTLDLSSWDTSSVTNMTFMFHWSSDLNVSGWDTSQVTNMSSMFDKVGATNLDVSNWDTSNVETMRSMFQSTSNLTYLDVSNWDISNVINLDFMFSRTGVTHLDVSNWDTGNVESMRGVFSHTNLTHLDVSSWDTSNVTNMGSMFSSASIENLDVSNWDTSNVRTMSSMFNRTRNLTSLDVSNWNTSNVTQMSTMFTGTSITTLDLSNWNTSNVENMTSMFQRRRDLNTLILGSNFEFVCEEGRCNATNQRNADFPIFSTTDWQLGRWQNVGTGTPEAPNGEHILTSAELVEQFNGQTMADTFIWQPHQPTPPPQQPIAPPRPTYHVIQSGDTLYELALRYQTTVAEFIRLNNIENPDFIQVGQTLIIPPPRMVTVRFYYYDTTIDPQVMFIEEAWAYESISFRYDSFWGHFIPIMQRQTGIELLGVYHVDGMTHIDLAPDEWQRFNEGSTGVGIRWQTLFRTLASIPYLAEVRILIDGERDVSTGHVSFCGTFILQHDGNWEHLHTDCW